MISNKNSDIPEGHSPDPEVCELGRITFLEELLEKEINNGKRVNFNSIGECKIEVYANEGPIPHFHLSSLNKKFETCICIYSNNFFSHGGKYRDTLSTNQCKLLNDYLKTESKSIGLSVWDTIRTIWDTYNDNNLFPKERKTNKQPDYSKMTQFKDA